MLESAAKSPSVKRIVITSSIVALFPFSEAFGPTGTVYNEKSRISLDEGPYQYEFQAYSASKAAAYNATLKWMEERKPNFDVVNLAPSFIMGTYMLDWTPEDEVRGTDWSDINAAVKKLFPE